MSQQETLPPPSAADLVRIQAIEVCAFNAWPAVDEVRHGDWVLRLAGGFTKRANSANAVAPQADFSGVQAAAETLYARHGLPAIFRLTPLACPHADDQLQAAGYAAFDPSCVMTRALGNGLPPANAEVDIAHQPSSAWLDGFAAANGVAPQHQTVHHRMVRAIAQPTGFATLRQSGQAIGFGLAVRERDTVGFYDIVIAPAHRHRGHGATLMHALLHWAQQDGARWAYLQVREHNLAARQLYTGLGFTDLYRYHYRVPSGS